MIVPEKLKPRKEEQGQLFKSGFLESMTHSSIYVPITMHFTIAMAFLYLTFSGTSFSATQIWSLFVGGWITWTLLEYWIHRIVYHTDTHWNWLLSLQHMAHGIHHQYPKDAQRLAMPPVPALIGISIFFGLFYLIMGVYAMAFFPGFLIGYMVYLFLHYAQHRWKAPKFGPLKQLWKAHALHHYKYPETKSFGVSTRLWDFVFRTNP